MTESRVAVTCAIAANIAIAITKFIAAGMTGSSAMLSEGIHSLVDTANDALLLVGLRLSQRPATERHPFGHGKEIYFWALIVAMLLFGVGGGLSIHDGITHWRNPPPLENPFWNYVVLAAAAVFEGASFLVALHKFNDQRNGAPFWKSLHASKDPAVYTVLAEDFVALLGLSIAAAGVYFSHAFNEPRLDAVASIGIGLLLAAIAVVLVIESRGLLLGEGILPETAREIRSIVRESPDVRGTGPLLSMYIGSEEVLVALDVHFDPGVSAARTAEIVHRIEQRIRDAYPRIKRIYLEAVTLEGTQTTIERPLA